jgi:hypothetical protein
MPMNGDWTRLRGFECPCPIKAKLIAGSFRSECTRSAQNFPFEFFQSAREVLTRNPSRNAPEGSRQVAPGSGTLYAHIDRHA